MGYILQNFVLLSLFIYDINDWAYLLSRIKCKIEHLVTINLFTIKLYIEFVN